MPRLQTLALVFALLAVPAQAADKTPATLQLLAIRATTENGEISAPLRPLAKQLKQQFKFSGYQLVDRNDARVELGKEHKAALPADYEIALKPESREDGRIAIRVEVVKVEKAGGKTKRTPKLRTVLKMKAGATVLLGGWQLDRSDVLIVALTAR